MFEDRMAALRARFLADAAAQRAALSAALGADDRESMRWIAHGLAGRGGTFGYPELSEKAQELEEAIDTGGSSERLRELGKVLIEALDRLDQPR